MKRPLALVALFYGSGVALGEICPVDLSRLFVLAILLTAACLARSRFRPHLIWPLLVVLGWTNLAAHVDLISPADLRAPFGESPELMRIRGRLAETPAFRLDHGEEGPCRSIVSVEVSAFSRDENWETGEGRILTQTGGRLDERFYRGQPVEIRGVIHPPKSPIADGLFDYRKFLGRQGIYFQLDVSGTNDWVILDPGSPRPWSDRFFSWSKKILSQGLPEEDESLRLLWAMTLGWKTALTDEVSEPFMESGTMHIFAISGLHIALISGILISLLRVLRLPRVLCGTVVIPLIWFYTLATGWQSSAIRSTIMMSIVIAGWSLKRPADLVNSLGAAAFIILILEPRELFQAGFQLSFCVVLSIGLVLPQFEKLRRPFLLNDPWLPDDLRPRWQRWVDPPIRFVTTSLATSFAAWVGSLPLIACYFHMVTPVSLLANLMVVPLSSLALMSNLGSLVCGDWFPWATGCFNEAAWLFMLLMARLSAWCAALPAAFFYVPAPPPGGCLLYYLWGIGLVTGYLWMPSVRRWTIAGLAIVAAFVVWRGMEERRTAMISILPLNGGDAVFCDAPGRRKDLLVDCGNANGNRFITTPYLRARGVNAIATFALTHADLREIGGATNLAGSFTLGRVIADRSRFHLAGHRSILDALKRHGESIEPLAAGDAIGSWRILHPPASVRFPHADDNSLVLLGNIFGTKILLLSDLGRAGQEMLLRRNPTLRADIVVAGLPSHGEPLGDALLERVRPQLIVLTDADFPAMERASSRLRLRLSGQPAPVFYCRRAGAVTVICRPGQWEARSRAGSAYSGRPAAGE